VRGNVVDGLHKLEEEAPFGKYAKAAQAEWTERAHGGLQAKQPVAARGWAGWAGIGEKKWFPNKIWFLNILSLWKFAQEDLGGILTWGFFLNSSRHLKDFRKIRYAMPCYATLGKIN
jgi:hypothetical protein